MLKLEYKAPLNAAPLASLLIDCCTINCQAMDAVKHLVLCRIERRPPRLDMTVYPYLPKAHVAVTSPGDYMTLLSGGR